MPEKSKSIIRKLMRIIILIFPTILSLIHNMPRLIEYETKFAINNLILTIILAVFFTLLLTISWIAVLGLFFIFFINLNYNIATSLTLVLLLNIVLLMIIGLSMLRVKKNLFKMFRRSR